MTVLERWLTVSAYATAMQVDDQTVYRAIAKGELPHRKVGRSIRISPEALLPAPTAPAVAAADVPPEPGQKIVKRPRGRPRKRQLWSE
jgi:excisionase family DNA binding protein